MNLRGSFYRKDRIMVSHLDLVILKETVSSMSVYLILREIRFHGHCG